MRPVLAVLSTIAIYVGGFFFLWGGVVTLVFLITGFDSVRKEKWWNLWHGVARWVFVAGLAWFSSSP
jgi:hypothetical protein